MKLFSNGIIGLLGLGLIFGNLNGGGGCNKSVFKPKFERFDCVKEKDAERWNQEQYMILEIGKKEYLFVSRYMDLIVEHDWPFSNFDRVHEKIECNDFWKKHIEKLKANEK